MIVVAGVEYLTAAEAAQLWDDVDQRRIYDWARRGLIAAVPVGRRRYYPLPALWLAERDTRASRRGRRRGHGKVADGSGASAAVCSWHHLSDAGR